MKYIVKNEPPEEFMKWMDKDPPKTWITLTRGGRPAAKRIKKSLWDSLVQEQGAICCYCERRIEAVGSSSHIEHLKPKCQFSALDLDYQNLICSCQSDENGKQTSNTCGHKKKEQLIKVTPLMEHCETEIYYTSSGELKGSTEDSKSTIETLGLNHYDLARSRKGIIEHLYTVYDKESIKEYFQLKDDRFSIFHTSVKQAFGL